jgi:hypothetical protein
MLVDGKFVKEAPPKIGAHYARDVYQRNVSPEEHFIQDVVLGVNPCKVNILEKIMGKLLRL